MTIEDVADKADVWSEAIKKKRTDLNADAVTSTQVLIDPNFHTTEDITPQKNLISSNQEHTTPRESGPNPGENRVAR